LDNSVWGLFWKMIGDGSFELLKFKRFIDTIPKDITKIKEYALEILQQPSDIDTVYRFLFLQACSFGGTPTWIEDNKWKKNGGLRNYWLPTETSNRKSPVNPMMPMPQSLYERVKLIVDKMKGVNALHMNIEDFNNFDSNSIIYIDPPYENTHGYGYKFNTDSYIKTLPHKCYVSEGKQTSENAIRITGSRKKGGINGNRKSKNEEWLNIFNEGDEKMKEFEVNFILSGNYLIDAKDEEHARDLVNEFINSKWQELEFLLNTGIKDDDYTTDVIES
jgi:hypothetical protein